MKPIITFVALTGLIAGYALADEPTGTAGDSVAAVKDILIQIEHQWGDAMVKGDVPAFSQCVADDWILTTSNGSRITKQIAQADLREGALMIESFQLDDVIVRVYGDAAVVLGLITEKSSLRGQDTSGQRRFTDVFIKREGRWQAVVSHESHAASQ